MSRTGKNEELKLNAKAVNNSEVHSVEWFCVKHRERKYMRTCKGTFDIFSGIVHRMRKEEMEEQFNRETKQGWRFAADAARNTNDNASSELQAHVGSRLCGQSAVIWEQSSIRKKELLCPSLGNEGRAEAWVNVRRGLQVFEVYFWHSDGWPPRHEALMEAVV